MYTIITYLLAQIQELNKQILFLFKFIVKNIPLNNLSKGDDKSLFSPKYRKLKVDELPKIIVPEKKDYKVLIKNYSNEHDGKVLKPIKHRGNFIAPKNLHCPYCNAPSDYIYDNTGGRGQYWCKVCDTHFNKQNLFDNDHIYKCPYCNKSLEPIKNRKNFIIHKCKNLNCSFYLNSFNSLSVDDKLEFSQHPERFKLHHMDFEVTQVIGLTNEDSVSAEYRWLKQNIERLNRTFKFSYKVTNGYGSDTGSNSHLALFVAYYNFLRPHHSFKNDVLNHIPELDNIELMPAKWQMLIKLSQELIISKQTT